MFNGTYQGKKVFITGHTGFKGSWLCLWLLNLGANVKGYSLEPPSEPSHYKLLELPIESVINDIRNRDSLHRAINGFQPEIVFHLAAQSLVLRSYKDPIGTFETNVIGTLNVLEACRRAESVQTIVNVTSDKCYENRKWLRGYRENDTMGGHDPYSASKGCAELVTASYRRSFFNPRGASKGDRQLMLASVRAGNVIGGGDWGEDRLIPDIIKAASKEKRVFIRSPEAIRPWQHVLEPLSGYLLLGQHLLEREKNFEGAWNFGPHDAGHENVLNVVKALQDHWPAIDFQVMTDERNPHEATLLKLDCSKAHSRLGWMPLWNGSTMFLRTAQWYREFYESGRVLSQEQLQAYMEDAKQQGMIWTKA